MTAKHPDEIHISEVLSEAWQLISGIKMPVFFSMLLIILVSIPAIYFLHEDHAITESYGMGGEIILAAASIVYGTIALFVYTFLIAICTLLGVRQAAGMSLDTRLVIDECREIKWRIFWLYVVNLIIINLINIAAFLIAYIPLMDIPIHVVSIIAVLYCALAIHVFALPLMLTTQCSVEHALRSGFAMMRQYYLSVLACALSINLLIILLYFLSVFIGVMPLGYLFGILMVLSTMIWFIPMLYTCYGILFRDAYGLHRRLESQRDVNAGRPPSVVHHPGERVPEETPYILDVPPEK